MLMSVREREAKRWKQTAINKQQKGRLAKRFEAENSWWFLFLSWKGLRINVNRMKKSLKGEKNGWGWRKRNKFVIIAYSTSTTILDSTSSLPTLLCRSPRLTFIYSKHYLSVVCVRVLVCWQVSRMEIEFSLIFMINNSIFPCSFSIVYSLDPLQRGYSSIAIIRNSFMLCVWKTYQY